MLKTKHWKTIALLAAHLFADVLPLVLPVENKAPLHIEAETHFDGKLKLDK